MCISSIHHGLHSGCMLLLNGHRQLKTMSSSSQTIPPGIRVLQRCCNAPCSNRTILWVYCFSLGTSGNTMWNHCAPNKFCFAVCFSLLIDFFYYHFLASSEFQCGLSYSVRVGPHWAMIGHGRQETRPTQLILSYLLYGHTLFLIFFFLYDSLINSGPNWVI